MKKLFALLLALCMIVALIGCGAKAESAPEDGYDSGYYTDDFTSESPMEDAPAMDAPATDVTEDVVVEGSGFSDLDIQAPKKDSSKLIYRASYDIETQDFTGSYNAISAAAQAAGGYISYEYIYGTKPETYGDSGRTAELELRIPTERYESFSLALSGSGTVVSKNSSVEDVSSQYYDTEARIEMLETRYSKLEEHMKNATDMNDIILLESEMSQILYELDILKGERRHLDDQIAYSTFNVTLYEVVKAGDVSTSGDVGERAGEAFSGTWKALGIFLEDTGVFLAGAAPVIIILAALAGVVGGIIILCIRVSKKRAAAKQAAKPADGEK
ncbi:MAG: DUF4349 domain-containing protein [Christensenellaceae bacterium]|nr:DUF4349 domain-containing protein [Christensenellaceae bacterium]